MSSKNPAKCIKQNIWSTNFVSPFEDFKIIIIVFPYISISLNKPKRTKQNQKQKKKYKGNERKSTISAQ